MSFVSGTGLISGGGGGSSTSTSVSINIDHEAVIKNTDDIASLSSVVNNLTTNDIPESTDQLTNNLYYTDDRVDANIALKDTDDITEGSTNLYYTDDRFDTQLGTKDTDDLTEGITNKYYTNDRFDTQLGTKTTDNLTEGSTNKYYDDSLFTTSLLSKTTDNLTEGSTNIYYTDDRVESYLVANNIYNTLKIDNNQEILLNGSPNANFQGNVLNASLSGFQMSFDLLNNISRTLTYEANTENITIHSANLIIGSTLPNGNICLLYTSDAADE